MQFGLSEEQVLLQDNVKRFLEEQYPLDKVREIATGKENNESLWQGLAELGVTAMLIPEALGGLGMSMLDAAVVSEQLGYHVSPAPFASTAVIAPVILCSENELTDERKEQLLAGIAEGSTRVGIAFGEAIGARDRAGVTAENGKLNGRSIFVMDGDADCYIVAVKEGNGTSLFLVEAGSVQRNELPTIDRTRSTCELVFNNSEAELVSNDDSLFTRAMHAGLVVQSADTLGAAQNMLDQAVEYARQREQFNRPIATFQAVKHMCAEMAAELEPCRAMVWYAGHAFDKLPDEAAVVSLQCKAHISEVGKFVAKIATEVHGGMGFTDLVGLHYWFKRIGFNRQMLGTPEYLREQAAMQQGLVSN